MQQSNHFDSEGKAVMVDVSFKEATQRRAVAGGSIYMNAAAFCAVAGGTAKKGDVLGVARVAGIMAVKKTPHLIPLCHPIAVQNVHIDFVLNEANSCVEAFCTVQTYGQTGVEMEALCGVSLALLTIYDMCKALDKEMKIEAVCLLEKQGGKSGGYVR